jgi:hypothetical protein
MTEDYHPTIVEQRIPNNLMTPIEVWLLSYIFGNSYADDDVWFFADYEQPECSIYIDDDDDEFASALKQSRTIDPSFCNEVEEAIDGDFIELDTLGGYERIFQQIIRRSKGEIPYVRVQGSANLDWLIFGRFGGYAVLVTADHIERMSTREWLDERLVQLGFEVPRG